MDWISQNKMKSLLIAALVVLNLVTLSIIWFQAPSRTSRSAEAESPRRAEAVPLLSKALDLTPGQAARVESLLTSRRELSRNASDHAADLKRQLAEDLFKTPPDTAAARAVSEQIGRLQAEIELVRFQHFLALVEVCSPDQREKLKPIVISAFGRKPPKDEHMEAGSTMDQPPRKPDVGGQPGIRADRRQLQPPPERRGDDQRRDDRPTGPQSIEEKLSRYAERLDLSEKQVAQLRDILAQMRAKGETARRGEPDGAITRDQLRRAEDEAIMNILDPAQKREFEKMLAKRRPPQP